MRTSIAKHEPSEVDSFILKHSTVRADSAIARLCRKLERERNEAREVARWSTDRLAAACRNLKLDNVLAQIEDQKQAHPSVFKA